MTRVLLLGYVLLTAACGNKSFGSLCDDQATAPAACNTACNPAPGAQTNCPGGSHCSPEGKCDLQCTQGGTECGDGYSCTADGRCVSNGGGSGSNEPDANCPAVHATAMKVTPSIQLLIDRSGSMLHDFADNTRTGTTDPDPEKYETVRKALVDPQGVVTLLEDKVYFGATLFSSDPNVACPTLKSIGRAMNNKNAIATLIANNTPINMARTPTPPSIDAVVQDFMTNKPPLGSPPVIVLATDGLPNECTSNTGTQAQSVTAAKNAFAAGIRLYILAVGAINDVGAAQHVQNMANAGLGVQPGQPDATAYAALNPTDLAAAFQQIIGGALSCDLRLSGEIDPGDAPNGVVTVNSTTTLMYGRDWTLDADNITLHILGNACTMLKNLTNPVVDAAFPCGTIIL